MNFNKKTFSEILAYASVHARNILLPMLLLLLSSSCTVLKIVPSNSQGNETQIIEVNPDLRISSTGVLYMNFAGLIKTDFLPGGVKIEYKDKVIYVDPVAVQDHKMADLIFITHNHADHFSLPDIKLISHPYTKVIGPVSIARKLPDIDFKLAILGDQFDFNGIHYEVMPAYNIKESAFRMTIHKRSDKYLGYIISCDSTRIYIAGDTDFIPEMQELKNIDVAILPIGSGNTAMTPQAASRAAIAIKPDIVIPVHYEPGTRNLNIFKEMVGENCEVRSFLWSE